MECRRVVVTGLGILAANGVGKEDFWRAVKAGISGQKKVTLFDVSPYRCQTGAEVDHSSVPSVKNVDNASRFALAVGKEAITDARLDNDQSWNPHRSGIVVGTIHGGLITAERIHKLLSDGQYDQIDPRALCECALFTCSSHLARELKLNGPISTITTACASGTAAIGYAASLIKEDRADVMLAGGVDTLNEFIFSGFNALRLLSPTTCRPFDRKRDGILIGEGAAMIVLEELDHALRRDASIYGELAGYGFAGDAKHIAAPDREGAGLSKSIVDALSESAVAPHEVDYINAHGVGTEYLDDMECNAFERVFKDAAQSIPISSTKPLTGHAMGAAGAIEAIVCLLAMQDSFVPGMLNSRQIDFKYKLGFIPSPGRNVRVTTALSTSSGFGGQNAAIVFTRRRTRSMSVAANQKSRVIVAGIGLVHRDFISFRDFFAGRPTECSVGADDDLENRVSRKLLQLFHCDQATSLRQLDNLSRYAILAAKLAVDDAQLDLSQVTPQQLGVILGTAFGSLESDIKYHEKLLNGQNPLFVNSSIFRSTTSNIPASQVSIYLNLRGVNATITSGMVSGANAIAYSYDLIRERRAAIILCGGIERVPRKLFDLLVRVQGRMNSTLADGAAILALESLESASQRSAKVYSELVGYGSASGQLSASEAMERAMRIALKRAGVNRKDVEYVSLCSSETVEDHNESAIEKVFEQQLSSNSLKLDRVANNYVGWGALSAVYCVRAIQQGAKLTLSNTMGPDGNCFSLVLKHYSPE